MKYKITKIAASKRKSDKKKNKGQPIKKLSKDPGVPNLAPFKESVLNQIKENKLRVSSICQDAIKLALTFDQVGRGKETSKATTRIFNE
jgi:hypothetical protein